MKVKFNTVSDIYLEQYKVARGLGRGSQQNLRGRSQHESSGNKKSGIVIDSYS